MKIGYLGLFLFFLFCSCSTFKNELVQTGGQEEAVQNAILDFSNTSHLYKIDMVFSISYNEEFYKMNFNGSEWVRESLYKELTIVSISANYNKILLPNNAKVGEKNVKMPTRYIEKDGKLFYWWDSKYPLTQKALDVFNKYDLLVKDNIDGLIEFYDFEIDDNQKGVDYYFCRDDLTRYKKVVTNKGLGYYDPPKLECTIQ